MTMSTCFFFLLFVASSNFVLATSSHFISNNVLLPKSSSARSLLQAEKSCEVDMGKLDYSVIVRKCRGPNYTAKDCCSSFKKVACPYSGFINDLTRDCATNLFGYINHFGNYPNGLFFDLCKEGKYGLDCAKYKQVTFVSLVTNTSQNTKKSA